MAGSIDAIVGIPTMNNEDTIEQTIMQLQRQTQLPDKVIIVDNSSDSTPEIIQKVSEEVDFNIDLLDQPNFGRGVGAARTKIYNDFNGDILICLDTNHSVDQNWVETHIEFHRSHPNYGILSNSHITKFNSQVDNPLRSEFFGQSNCSIKKSALDNIDGWDPNFHRGEDWDMRIRLWTAGEKSWATNTIAAERIQGDAGSDMKNWFKNKTLYDPSSVTYIRKYGLWYIKFHPLHLFGDISSVLSLLSLCLSLLLSPISLLASTIFLLIPMILSTSFVYYKGPRKENRFIPRRKHLGAFFVFYALGLSALMNILRTKEVDDWNYSGFDESVSK